MAMSRCCMHAQRHTKAVAAMTRTWRLGQLASVKPCRPGSCNFRTCRQDRGRGGEGRRARLADWLRASDERHTHWTTRLSPLLTHTFWPVKFSTVSAPTPYVVLRCRALVVLDGRRLARLLLVPRTLFTHTSRPRNATTPVCIPERLAERSARPTRR